MNWGPAPCGGTRVLDEHGVWAVNVSEQVPSHDGIPSGGREFTRFFESGGEAPVSPREAGGITRRICENLRRAGRRNADDTD